MSHHPSIRRFHIFLLLAALLAAVPAGAQVRGRVVDAAERPVAGAVVELWAGAQTAGQARTDAAGRFEIGSAPAEPGSVLTVRRVGLRTRTIPLGAGDAEIVVRMEEQPVVLQTLSVVSTRQPRCPNREDPRARALWERMRSRYWQESDDTVFVLGFLEMRSGVGEKSDAWRPEAAPAVPAWTTGALVEAHPWFMSRSGYASRANGGAGERTAWWLYRSLDNGSLQDFTGAHFGAVHTLSIAAQTADRTTIAFCPRGRMTNTGQIAGTLVLDADATLSLASWSFRTPDPDEDAGGEASYFPPDPRLGRALLARETLFWRKTNPPRYYFESRSFTGWQRRDRDTPYDPGADARQ